MTATRDTPYWLELYRNELGIDSRDTQAFLTAVSRDITADPWWQQGRQAPYTGVWNGSACEGTARQG
jgi:hypothetical protein